MWLDLDDGNTNETELALFHGGEVSMWSDRHVATTVYSHDDFMQTLYTLPQTFLVLYEASLVHTGS